jgi:hypothetical protein
VKISQFEADTITRALTALIAAVPKNRPVAKEQGQDALNLMWGLIDRNRESKRSFLREKIALGLDCDDEREIEFINVTSEMVEYYADRIDDQSYDGERAMLACTEVAGEMAKAGLIRRTRASEDGTHFIVDVGPALLLVQDAPVDSSKSDNPLFWDEEGE